MDKKSEKKDADPDIGDIKKCFILGKDEWVYDYYNQQMNKEEEQEFEEHLFECDRCQDVLLMLDWAYTELRANASQYAGSKALETKRRPSMKAKSTKV